MFTHVGMGNYVNSDEVYMVMRTGGGHARNIRSVAENEGRFYNLSGGRALKSLIIYKNGVVAGSGVTSITLRERLNVGDAVRLGGEYMRMSNGGVASENTDNDDFLLEERDGIEREDTDEEDEDGEALG